MIITKWWLRVEAYTTILSIVGSIPVSIVCARVTLKLTYLMHRSNHIIFDRPHDKKTFGDGLRLCRYKIRQLHDKISRLASYWF